MSKKKISHSSTPHTDRVEEAGSTYLNIANMEGIPVKDQILIKRAIAILKSDGKAADFLRLLLVAGLSLEDQREPISDNLEHHQIPPDLKKFREALNVTGSLTDTLLFDRDENRY